MSKQSDIKRKFSAVKQILDAEIEGEVDLPKRTILFALTDKELSALITKRRLELIRVIGKKKPRSIQQRADFVDRKLPAVDRDIKILVKNDIVKTKRTSKGMQPIMNKDILVIPLTEPKRIEEIAV